MNFYPITGKRDKENDIFLLLTPSISQRNYSPIQKVVVPSRSPLNNLNNIQPISPIIFQNISTRQHSPIDISQLQLKQYHHDQSFVKHYQQKQLNHSDSSMRIDERSHSQIKKKNNQTRQLQNLISPTINVKNNLNQTFTSVLKKQQSQNNSSFISIVNQQDISQVKNFQQRDTSLNLKQVAGTHDGQKTLNKCQLFNQNFFVSSKKKQHHERYQPKWSSISSYSSINHISHQYLSKKCSLPTSDDTQNSKHNIIQKVNSPQTFRIPETYGLKAKSSSQFHLQKLISKQPQITKLKESSGQKKMSPQSSGQKSDTSKIVQRLIDNIQKNLEEVKTYASQIDQKKTSSQSMINRFSFNQAEYQCNVKQEVRQIRTPKGTVSNLARKKSDDKTFKLKTVEGSSGALLKQIISQEYITPVKKENKKSNTPSFEKFKKRESPIQDEQQKFVFNPDLQIKLEKMIQNPEIKNMADNNQKINHFINQDDKNEQLSPKNCQIEQRNQQSSIIPLNESQLPQLLENQTEVKDQINLEEITHQVPEAEPEEELILSQITILKNYEQSPQFFGRVDEIKQLHSVKTREFHDRTISQVPSNINVKESNLNESDSMIDLERAIPLDYENKVEQLNEAQENILKQSLMNFNFDLIPKQRLITFSQNDSDGENSKYNKINFESNECLSFRIKSDTQEIKKESTVDYLQSVNTQKNKGLSFMEYKMQKGFQ